ncbi:MAG: DUF2961 domain-containing protein [Armatimonadetes bacterium]|jgi:hypothetical protein|nr:DUF2961 domain-containing protein [Armatimonadota bacterium]MDI9603283.1 DUF2961 domain-containing protein [Acidobacteriota bacterium]
MRPTDMLSALARPIAGRARRISSNQQPEWNDGNFDMTRIPAGQVFELPLMEGPGVITHIWMTSHSGHLDRLDQLILRIYWDGAEEPAVEVPLGDFFACGHGKRLIVNSLPVQVSESGALTCYWRMPFLRSARITVTNDNPTEGTGLYWMVDYMTYDELPEDTPYFCARYRQEFPCVMGRDYRFLDARGRGHYVGAVLSTTLCQDGWFGEGDDFFYIDGEEVPSLQGTGTEDYFNDAWGYRERTTPFFGQTLWEGYEAGDRGCMYRWHVLDPVPFTESIQVDIEHKGNMEPPVDGWYVERPDFFSSVAFWYQIGQPEPFGGVPPWGERRPPWITIAAGGRIADAKAPEGAPSPVLQLIWARPLVFWQNEDPAGVLELPFDVPESGRYAARLTAITSYDYGIWDVELDGEAIASRVDLYSRDTGSTEVKLGARELAAGEHVLTFRCAGANPSSRAGAAGPGHFLGVEAIRLLPLPEPVQRPLGQRDANERQWLTREIASAVAGFRQARGEAPESLQALVDGGFLGERYLLDENEQPLESRREAGKLVVSSVGPDGVAGTEDDWTQAF